MTLCYPNSMKKIYLILLIAQFPFHLFCQQSHVFALHSAADIRIGLDTTIHENSRFEPFASQMAISGLAFSGEIKLHSDTSLVRIILEDNDYNEYLIYEAYPILSGSGRLSVDEAGDETSLLNHILPGIS